MRESSMPGMLDCMGKDRLKAGQAIRTVTLSRCTPDKGRPRLWAFGFDELGAILGLSALRVRRMIAAGKLDPGDLHAVCEAWAARAGHM